jgi:hypothetical protein
VERRSVWWRPGWVTRMYKLEGQDLRWVWSWERREAEVVTWEVCGLKDRLEVC